MCYITSSLWASGGMADTQVLGTCVARRESSSLSSPTSECNNTGLLTLVVPKLLNKFVATHVALKKKCCKVERVCIGFKRLLGHWLVLGTNNQTHTYPLLHNFQQYQHVFFKNQLYPAVGSFCNKCNKCINLRHLSMQHSHYCIHNLIRNRT